MDFTGFLEALKILRLHDTTTALVLVAMAAFYIGTRLQKKVGQFATKEELKTHKKSVYVEVLRVQDAVKVDLAGFGRQLEKHEKDDTHRFEALDEKQTGLFDNVFKQIGSARRSLARLEGHFKIEKPKDEEEV